MGELVNVRRGTQRADDVHPLQWWVLSEAARRDAAAAWKIKHGEILRAMNRRSTPRVPSEKMPPSTTTSTTPQAMMALVSQFLVSEDTGTTNTTTTTKATPARTASSVDVEALYEDCDWTLRPAEVSDTAETEDQPPPLVYESDDEDWRNNGEIQ